MRRRVVDGDLAQRPAMCAAGERKHQPHAHASRKRQAAEALDQVRDVMVDRIAERHQGRPHIELRALALDPGGGRDWIGAPASDRRRGR